MPIHAPGYRPRYRRVFRKSGKRRLMAELSLTAMVDMFTVLVIFLLQNYNITGAIIEIPSEVVLPPASQIKELKPSHVVILTPKSIIFNNKKIASTEEIRETEKWMIPKLFDTVKTAIDKKKIELQKKGVLEATKEELEAEKTGEAISRQRNIFRKVTVEADKNVDFLTVKKVMYTITEAGGAEINFAVVRVAPEEL
jgi:biopolymer transport protein ExbD